MRAEHWIYTLPLRVRSLFRRRQVEQELDEEMAYHLEQRAREFVDKGLSAEDARLAALREMHGMEARKEECRDMRKVTWIQDLFKIWATEPGCCGRARGSARWRCCRLRWGLARTPRSSRW